jgi:hypothetical protein
MARFNRFTILCSQEERRLIAALADRLRRSQSDALRFLIVSAAREREIPEQPKTKDHPNRNTADEN